MAKFEIKYLFLSHGILAFIFGIGFLILPIPITTLMGLSLGDDGIAIARICGSLILGFGMIAFSFKKEHNSTLRQQIILAFIVVYTIMTVLNFIFFDLTNFMVWFLIILHAFFVVAYGYFFIQNRGK